VCVAVVRPVAQTGDRQERPNGLPVEGEVYGNNGAHGEAIHSGPGGGAGAGGLPAGADSFPAPSAGGTPPQNGGALLSAFDGASPNGAWSLCIVDDDETSIGKLTNGWSLVIKARVRR
jgi:hypothetical protein